MNGTQLDKKTQDTLLRAVDRAKDHSRQLEMRREKELWKEIDTPCRHIDLLSLLKKHELDSIRKRLDLKGLSTLNKGALASELERLIPIHFEKILHKLDQERYDLIHEIVKNSKYTIKNNEISISKVETLMEWGIIFPGIEQGQRFLTMPAELVELFSKIDGPELKNIICRNTEWIGLTHGMLYYYGVMETFLILQKVRQYTQQKVDSLEYLHVFSAASKYYGQAKFSSNGVSLEDDRVFETEGIIDEHNKRSSIDFYPFTKEQLLNAGETGYIDRVPAMDKFLGFLLEHYDLTQPEIEDLAMQLINIINMDDHPSMMIKYLNSRLEFPTFEFVQEITAHAMEIYNQTRMWILKGYSPSELAQEEMKHLLPLPSVDENKKVGRNDPCPCGSGKKYKKCCGK
ncbi:SEC-C metal-binding domain-containing protein [Neobacillus sp. PS2-9]|uniref:YecA family protein n=1 Tax=Neobacillus sp. PS2-9 TaxID=3070676 RepID=UPI0027E09E1E|nr:SEC-C metal-binding domain-containing protein [Neobacillus sp. PS2-9]WML58800.1 SEC-C metal-binding domain-containing protein [Neobacillus sp. PS2-9]